MAIIGTIGILLGVLFLMHGRSGVRQGGHFHCRKCDFSLHGLSPDTHRCPECGADIRAGDAMRVGRRTRVKGYMVAGVVLMAMGAATLGLWLLTQWPSFNGARFKTASQLETDMQSGDPTQRQWAENELLRRINAKSLSAAQVNEIADDVLSAQMNPAGGWDRGWGDLVQAGHAAKQLTAERWQWYLEEAIDISARVRKRVRMGDPIPFAITCTLRAGSDYSAMAPVIIAPSLNGAINSERWEVSLHAGTLDVIPVPLNWTEVWMKRAGDTLGPETVVLHVIVKMEDSGGTSVEVNRVFTLPLEMVEGDSVELSASPTQEAEMNSAIHVRTGNEPVESDGFVRDTTPALAVRAGAPGTMTLGHLWISAPPVAVAFRVVLRQAGHEWSAGRVMVRPGDAANEVLSVHTSDGGTPVAGAAEITLIPDPELARGTVDVVSIWGNTVHRPVTLMIP